MHRPDGRQREGRVRGFWTAYLSSDARSKLSTKRAFCLILVGPRCRRFRSRSSTCLFDRAYAYHVGTQRKNRMAKNIGMLRIGPVLRNIFVTAQRKSSIRVISNFNRDRTIELGQ